ncbi:MAG TPA: HD domain-containing protein [Chitinophagales bacterium]|nr:HD domain-containing protein [Chitinophagales bacterium]
MQFEQVKPFILDKLRKELPPHLSYHSVFHVEDVFEAATMLAESENVTGEDRTLLLTAVLFHDSGFLEGMAEHEEASCRIASQILPRFEYSEDQIKRICGMIMATRIPQTPHNLLEEIICDADLDYLGRDDFFAIGNRLFAELRVYGIIRTQEQWDDVQIKFLETHAYFTKTAIRLRKEKKDSYLAHLKSKRGVKS